jgi:hypothetical protein
MSVIIIDGKTMVEVDNALVELEKVMDTLIRRSHTNGLPWSAQLYLECTPGQAWRERNR